MDKQTLEQIAWNLTIAFYNGQILPEPFLGDDERSTFYSPDYQNRIPTVSLKEVYSVYERFREMLKASNND